MRIDDVEAARTPEGRALISAWLSWRGEAVVPRRSDMILNDILSVLPHVTIIEEQEPNVFVFRLAGTYVFETTGSDLTGKDYVAMAAPELRPLRAARLSAKVRQPCGSRTLFEFRTQLGTPAQCEIIALPLRQDRDDAPMQIINVIGLLDTTLQQEIRHHRVSLSPLENVSDCFQFLDIGAGLPSAA